MPSRKRWVKGQGACGMDIFLLSQGVSVHIRTLLGVGERSLDCKPRQTAALHCWINPKRDGKPCGKVPFPVEHPIATQAVSAPVPSPAAPQRWPWLLGAKLLVKPYLGKAAKIGCWRIIPQPSSAGNTTTENKRRNWRRTPEDGLRLGEGSLQKEVEHWQWFSLPCIYYLTL